MSDHEFRITNDDINGQTLKCNTSIASMFTCKEFLKKLLERIRENEELRNYFITDNADNYTVITLPMALCDFSMLSPDTSSTVVKVRDNYSRIRAEQECLRYARSFYEEGDPFFKSDFYKQFVNSVTSEFSNDKKTVKVVSQNSLFKTNTRIVNLLLNKKMDGRENIQRRRKVKEVIKTLNEETGEEFETYVYYTQEDIDKGEAELRLEHSVATPIFLDIDYREFTIEQFMMTIFASITPQIKSDSTDFIKYSSSIDEIFVFGDDSDDSTEILCSAMSLIGKHDTEILKIIDEKGSNICSIVNNDIVNQSETLKKSAINKVEIYNCLLKHCRFIFPIVEYFYDFINSYKNISITESDIGKIFGVDKLYVIGKDEDGDDVLSPLGDLENFLIDKSQEIKTMANGFNFLFNITPALFKCLFIGILKFIFGNSSNTANMMINFVSNHIGLNSSKDNAYNSLITEYYETVIGKRPVEIVFSEKIIVGFLNQRGISENIISYIYRNAQYYMNSENKFKINLSVIIDAFEKNSRMSSRELTQKFSMAGTNFLFNTENLLNTITRMTGKESNMAYEPFCTYSKINEANLKIYNDKNEALNKIITEKYGEAFSRCIIPLPSIPFSRDELEWLKIKCLDLKAKIEDITSRYPEVPFDDYHDVFHELKTVQNKYAESDVDDPKFVEKIDELKGDIARFYEICKLKEVPDSVINNINQLENSLFVYTNHHLIKFEFEKFSLKFKNGIGNQLMYHIGKNLILDENKNLKTCLSIYNDSQNAGIKYLENHFRPFFSEFATINASKFNLSIRHELLDSKHLKDGKPVKYDELIMTVTYGDSDDAHMATKFRTKFTSFASSDELMHYAFEKYKNDNDNQLISKANFDISDMSLDFTIVWYRTAEQSAAISGDKNEVKMKIYNETCGCIEQYPFYDALGKRIVTRIFNINRNSYDSIIARQRENEIRRVERMKNKTKPQGFTQEDFENGIIFKSEAAAEIQAKSSAYWAEGLKTITGDLSINDAMKSIEKSSQPQKVPQRRQLRSVNPNNVRQTSTVERTRELQYIRVQRNNKKNGENEDEEGKWVTVYKKTLPGSKRKIIPGPISQTPNSPNTNTKTPKRFQGAYLGDNRGRYRHKNENNRDESKYTKNRFRDYSRSSERKSGSSKFGTPTGSSKDVREQRSVGSPTVDKHGFTQVGVSPNYISGSNFFTGTPGTYGNPGTPRSSDESYLLANNRTKSPSNIQISDEFITIKDNKTDDKDIPFEINYGYKSPSTIGTDGDKQAYVVEDDDFEV